MKNRWNSSIAKNLTRDLKGEYEIHSEYVLLDDYDGNPVDFRNYLTLPSGQRFIYWQRPSEEQHLVFLDRGADEVTPTMDHQKIILEEYKVGLKDAKLDHEYIRKTIDLIINEWDDFRIYAVPELKPWDVFRKAQAAVDINSGEIFVAVNKKRKRRNRRKALFFEGRLPELRPVEDFLFKRCFAWYFDKHGTLKVSFAFGPSVGDFQASRRTCSFGLIPRGVRGEVMCEMRPLSKYW